MSKFNKLCKELLTEAIWTHHSGPNPIDLTRDYGAQEARHAVDGKSVLTKKLYGIGAAPAKSGRSSSSGVYSVTPVIIDLPEGTIIHGLPGGIFADHPDIRKNKDLDINEKYGVGIGGDKDVIKRIVQVMKILER